MALKISVKRPTYERAVRWIADNDETAEMDPAKMVDLISVLFAADIWGVKPEQIARDVVKVRELYRAASEKRRCMIEALLKRGQSVATLEGR